VNQPPALPDLLNQTSAEAGSVSMLVSGVDPDGDALSYSATGLPPTLTMNPVSGLISGIPSFTSAGEYPVSVTVTDGRLSSSRSFTWIITNTNRAPMLTNPGAQTHSVRSEYAAAVMRDVPAAYWRLGEMSGVTAGDIAGSNSGALVGNVAHGQPGALADGDRGMLFDGTSGYIQASAMAGLAADLTIEMWVKMPVGSRQTLISKDYLREFELTVEPNGGLNFYQGNGVLGGNVQSAGGAVKPNVWQHVVVTRTAATNTIAFYVNGVAKGTGVASVSASAGNAPISIGRAKSGTRYTSGVIDEVALYPAVLTPAQVSTHYATSAWAPANEITMQVSATDPDGDPVTYSAVGLPPGLTLHPQTGRISGLVSSEHVGIYQVTVTAADQLLSSSHSFIWTITN
jgi:hypothetical protein